MPTTKRDYYDILGIGREASEDDIRKAFRKKALEYHPDRNKSPHAEASFKEAAEAYEILRDKEKRAAYDRFGHGGVSSNGGTGFEGVSGFPDFGDVFDVFFGQQGGRAGGPARGDDLGVSLTLEFDEAAFGIKKTIEVTRMEACARCHGARSEPGSKPERCKRCGGSGQLRQVQRSVFGQFMNVTPCPTCRGEGQTIGTPCTQCKGLGAEERTRSLEINIPAGVTDGAQVRLSGEGEVGVRGGPSGNLYVSLKVKEHPLFDRDGADLYLNLPLNVTQAMLGDEVDIPTLEGRTKLKVPAGTQPGAVFRLKGQGIAHLRGGGRGDIIVTADVVIPKSLDIKQRKLLEQLDQTLKKPEPSKKDKGFMNRVKEALG